ncbi:hypothetical protein ACU4GD_45285 [Cupriavidus basilensis]
MMMMAFVVIGLFSYQRLPDRPVPGHHLPDRGRADRVPRRRAGIGRIGCHPQDRGDRQHHLRHRRDLLALLPGANSVVVIKFDLTVDVGQAAQDVRDKIALIRPQFPRRGERPARAALRPVRGAGVDLSVSNAPGRRAHAARADHHCRPDRAQAAGDGAWRGRHQPRGRHQAPRWRSASALPSWRRSALA